MRSLRLPQRTSKAAALCTARCISQQRGGASRATSKKEQLHTTAPRSPGASSAAADPTSSSPAAPHVDAGAAEQMKVAAALGEEAFAENTAILKQVAKRGLRALGVCAVGLAAFSWAMRRRRRQLAKEARGHADGKSRSEDEDEIDPTQRYLEEMRGLGFDVDTLEEELELERRQKAAATTAAAPTKQNSIS